MFLRKILALKLFMLSFVAYAEDFTNQSSINFFGKHFIYQGAFRIPNLKLGESRIAYSRGVFTINSETNSFYIVGHNQDQAVAEFSIPKIIKSTNIKSLSYAKPLQNFSKVLNRSMTGNPQHINYITGMDLIENNLFINAIEYYDANADAKFTTLIIDQPSHLDKSQIRGFFELAGGAHAAGWISALPANLKNKFYGSHILGSASNFPIDSRLSMGPTAFISNLDIYANIKESSGLIPTTSILDFSLKKPLHPDPYNKTKQNHLWTEISKAVYGFVIPNTLLYFVIGTSGGHQSGIGYKITQDNGHICGGPCPYDHSDTYNYFWLWDVNKLQGKIGLSKNTQPNLYGELNIASPLIENNNIIGADFDFAKNRLYLLIGSADKQQNEYESAPLMLIYDLPQP